MRLSCLDTLFAVFLPFISQHRLRDPVLDSWNGVVLRGGPSAGELGAADPTEERTKNETDLQCKLGRIEGKTRRVPGFLFWPSEVSCSLSLSFLRPLSQHSSRPDFSETSLCSRRQPPGQARLRAWQR